MKHFTNIDLKTPGVRDEIIKRFIGCYHSVFIGLDAQTISDVLDRASSIDIISASADTIAEIAEKMKTIIPVQSSEIIICIKQRKLDYPISELAPLLELMSDININANTTWGLSIDANLSTNYKIDLLFTNKINTYNNETHQE